jgi:hypothetical protein
LGLQTNEWVEILDPPFPATANVITSGHQQLFSGSPIQIRESGTKPAAAQGTAESTPAAAAERDSPPSS